MIDLHVPWATPSSPLSPEPPLGPTIPACWRLRDARFRIIIHPIKKKHLTHIERQMYIRQVGRPSDRALILFITALSSVLTVSVTQELAPLQSRSEGRRRRAFLVSPDIDVAVTVDTGPTSRVCRHSSLIKGMRFFWLVALWLIYTASAVYVAEELTPIDDASPPRDPPNPSSMSGLVLCGYQGWFRTPSDDDNVGWQHWTRRWGYGVVLLMLSFSSAPIELKLVAGCVWC
jgi:hypothetical protein